MRTLHQNELTAVSGGTFCKPKPSCQPKPVCAPAPTCLTPLAYVLGFIGGAIKLLCTGQTSPTAQLCTPTPPTCGGGTPTGPVIL
ncbi:MAG TPA: hypothetical protein VFW84_10770 [Aquabacterium sp.]|uniref:hypothetical protein n=1 Tax=Aquabacterium sp. TaxID=1872578 RepID=UPI002E31BAF7|nr:hypothetical protein [Aquabacterium sp.]HEX5373202.1 hypothetical protein [Aquabacterium sp.]